MMQTMLEKLQYRDERNLLIQGLPSSVEKQFVKLSFAKNVTPLLRSRKIDFALVFAVNQNQLSAILSDVLPALSHDFKLWVAYPKPASKISSDLNRQGGWDCVSDHGFHGIEETCLDHVWSAIRFERITIEEPQPVNAPAPNPRSTALQQLQGSQASGNYGKVASHA
jgi:hypothetical protein